MGFPKERVEKVLKHFKNNMNVAMDYLLNTPEENDAAHITTAQQPQSSASSMVGGMIGSSMSSQQFAPDQDALNMLMEMGYERQDAIYALRVTGNNLENACAFLMSNPNPSQNESSSIGSNISSLSNMVREREELLNERNRIQSSLQRIMAATQALNQHGNR